MATTRRNVNGPVLHRSHRPVTRPSLWRGSRHAPLNVSGCFGCPAGTPPPPARERISRHDANQIPAPAHLLDPMGPSTRSAFSKTFCSARETILCHSVADTTRARRGVVMTERRPQSGRHRSHQPASAHGIFPVCGRLKIKFHSPNNRSSACLRAPPGR